MLAHNALWEFVKGEVHQMHTGDNNGVHTSTDLTHYRISLGRGSALALLAGHLSRDS